MSNVRHIIFSVSTPPALTERQLKRMMRAFARQMSRRQWIAVPREDKGHRHVDLYLKGRS